LQVEGGETELVDDDEVGAQDRVDLAGDGVVGQAAVEVVDQVGGGEVADPEPGGDGGVAEGDEDVRLAGAGRPDEAEVLGGADPLERGEVVERGVRDRRQADVELAVVAPRTKTPRSS
jgi:hypothetical protein